MDVDALTIVPLAEMRPGAAGSAGRIQQRVPRRSALRFDVSLHRACFGTVVLPIAR